MLGGFVESGDDNGDGGGGVVESGRTTGEIGVIVESGRVRSLEKNIHWWRITPVTLAGQNLNGIAEILTPRHVSVTRQAVRNRSSSLMPTNPRIPYHPITDQH